MKWKVVAVAVVGSLVGFMLDVNAPVGAAIWGPMPDGPEPAGGQIAALIVVSVVQSIGFGLGVAFLVFGWAFVGSAPVSRNLALAAYVAIGWGLVSWVPHSAMHMTNGAADFTRLIFIEYLYHVTLIFAAMALAWFFVQVIRGAQPTMKKAETKAVMAPAR